MQPLIFNRGAIWPDALALLRIWTGVIFVYHGTIFFDSREMLGFAASLEEISIPMPLPSAYLCKSTEFFGGICLIAGLARRIAAVFMVINMLVATFVYHHGLVFDDGRTTFILLICSLTLLLSPSDRFCVDWYVGR